MSAIDMLLRSIERFGGNGFRLALSEGPRRPGHCVYCAGPCQGVTTQCEVRVWEESLRLRREA